MLGGSYVKLSHFSTGVRKPLLQRFRKQIKYLKFLCATWSLSQLLNSAIVSQRQPEMTCKQMNIVVSSSKLHYKNRHLARVDLQATVCGLLGQNSERWLETGKGMESFLEEAEPHGPDRICKFLDRKVMEGKLF